MSSDYIVEITTEKSGKKADGTFSVNGRIEELDDSLEINDEIDGGTAQFNVHGGADTFRVFGKMTDFNLNGQAMVLVDGVSVRLKDLQGLGFTGPNAPQGYKGPGSSAWGGTGDDDGGPSGNSQNKSSSMNERVDIASGRDGRGSVQTFGPGDSKAFARTVFETDPFMAENVRCALDDGDYDVGAVLEGTVSTRGGAPSLKIVGNPENPRKVSIQAPGNLVKLSKDEHTWVEGVTFEKRTQLAGVGNIMARNCVFTDRKRASHSSLGGKPAGARIQNCDLGIKGNPDRYAAYLYGSGELHLDHGTTLRASGDAYIRSNNTAWVHVDKGVEFASGNKEIVAGTGIKPSDMSGDITTIGPGDQ